MGYDAESDMCDIKYTDYGGYDTVPASDLKQIRTDFLTLPFQVIGRWITDIDARFNVGFLRDFPDPLGPVTLAYVILLGLFSGESGSLFAFIYCEISSVALFDVGMN